MALKCDQQFHKLEDYPWLYKVPETNKTVGISLMPLKHLGAHLPAIGFYCSSFFLMKLVLGKGGEEGRVENSTPEGILHLNHTE